VPFLEQDAAAARSFLDGKLFGSWACARHAAPRMRSGGSITFLTGCAAIRPRAGLSMVTATFAALEALSQALALELGPLRVNTIRPGVVDSEMWSFLDDRAREELREKIRASFPARRIGSVEDIGHAAVFLMTNPYVTGTVLEVSGGEPLVALDP
jgi:NAD(P)-dependent dehydrogenase (short-subunit alcohol dehydrogenase family)